MLPSRPAAPAAPVPVIRAVAEPEAPSGKPLELAVEVIERNPYQTRTRFDETQLGELAQSIAKNDARMVQGIKRLLHEGAGLSWHERYELEDEARATWLQAGHPRDGFKDFLARKGKR